MESHVVIPEVIIKKFADKDGVSFIDFTKGEIIDKCTSDKIGTETDYYSKETELYLSKDYEVKLNELIKKIKVNNPILSNEDKDLIIEYFCKSYLRNPQTSGFVEEHIGFKHLKETIVKLDFLKKIYKYYEVKIIKSLCNSKFVLPYMGYYCNKYYDIYLPLHRDYVVVLSNGEVTIPPIIEDSKLIIKMNKAAYEQEKLISKKYVFGMEKDLKDVLNQ